ncbi:hypothetical protein, conserved [Thermococcus onnurineus NA1]|uniref:DUF3216 domain-containing protein n=1 Tax=Thermococcus onnurineus (strain NA1) TaxID=523850 RepID=B6YWG7_THEON|nr:MULTISPECIES: DUF3216 domain-containing protein [Thermococcus]ACJ16430.1 hypothetical protein, conserved [Thermococcus onnurineus NA1]NJE47586.1 DUF3216 domain-containing protein [Thermococcus sp. GR7]NJE79559.1 DUF3216 domain-containing protein [Thermococcus sp. GR4]NJE79572.1 DUF3216 domain-containing protein [Thermococcus sp. GR4]NJF22458.1 DUF3216 domain-containing protein [Thermococcus sp. GR5]
MNVPEIEELKKLCEELGEKELIARIDSFVALNEGLESKKGKEFIEVSILGFAEGMLTSLRAKYPGDERVVKLLERVSARRAELDEQFRKAKPPIFEG